MTLLVKETVTLHKVLSRYLPEGVLEVNRSHLSMYFVVLLINVDSTLCPKYSLR